MKKLKLFTKVMMTLDKILLKASVSKIANTFDELLTDHNSTSEEDKLDNKTINIIYMMILLIIANIIYRVPIPNIPILEPLAVLLMIYLPFELVIVAIGYIAEAEPIPVGIAPLIFRGFKKLLAILCKS